MNEKPLLRRLDRLPRASVDLPVNREGNPRAPATADSPWRSLRTLLDSLHGTGRTKRYELPLRLRLARISAALPSNSLARDASPDLYTSAVFASTAPVAPIGLVASITSREFPRGASPPNRSPSERRGTGGRESFLPVGHELQAASTDNEGSVDTPIRCFVRVAIAVPARRAE